MRNGANYLFINIFTTHKSSDLSITCLIELNIDLSFDWLDGERWNVIMVPLLFAQPETKSHLIPNDSHWHKNQNEWFFNDN